MFRKQLNLAVLKHFTFSDGTTRLDVNLNLERAASVFNIGRIDLGTEKEEERAL